MIAKSAHLAYALLGALMLAAAVRTTPAAGRHLRLVKTEPASGATVASPPKEINLWFSERPNLKLTRVVLTRAQQDTVTTGAPAVADSTGKQIRVRVDSAISAGRYEVNWRTLSRDGHAVGGKFAFTVDSTAPTKAATYSKPR